MSLIHTIFWIFIEIPMSIKKFWNFRKRVGHVSYLQKEVYLKTKCCKSNDFLNAQSKWRMEGVMVKGLIFWWNIWAIIKFWKFEAIISGGHDYDVGILEVMRAGCECGRSLHFSLVLWRAMLRSCSCSCRWRPLRYLFQSGENLQSSRRFVVWGYGALSAPYRGGMLPRPHCRKKLSFPGHLGGFRHSLANMRSRMFISIVTSMFEYCFLSV